jgi:FKBP-type peptidyl-prolyl cis-trans isomerase
MQQTISDPQSKLSITSTTPIANDCSNCDETVTMECKDENIHSEGAATALCNSADNKGLSEFDQDELSDTQVINPTKDINEDLEEGECTSDEEVVPEVQEPIKQESDEKKKDRKHRHRSRSRSRERKNKKRKKDKEKKHSAPKEEISEEEQKVKETKIL